MPHEASSASALFRKRHSQFDRLPHIVTFIEYTTVFWIVRYFCLGRIGVKFISGALVSGSSIMHESDKFQKSSQPKSISALAKNSHLEYTYLERSFYRDTSAGEVKNCTPGAQRFCRCFLRVASQRQESLASLDCSSARCISPDTNRSASLALSKQLRATYRVKNQKASALEPRAQCKYTPAHSPSRDGSSSRQMYAFLRAIEFPASCVTDGIRAIHSIQSTRRDARRVCASSEKIGKTERNMTRARDGARPRKFEPDPRAHARASGNFARRSDRNK